MSGNNRTAPQEKHQTLEQVLAHPAIWQPRYSTLSADKTAEEHRRTVQTGYRQLDALLHHGGWPTGKLIECLHRQPTQGELSLFMPALATLDTSDNKGRATKKQAGNSTQTPQRPILLIAPPYLPYANGWQQHIDVEQLWVLSTDSLKDQLWSIEQALRSNSCAAVISWLGKRTLNWQQLRKLQLAAQHNSGINILFRSDEFQHHSSAAALRIGIRPTLRKNKAALAIHLLKQPGSWGGQSAVISWHSHLQQQRQAIAEWPVYSPKHNGKLTSRQTRNHQHPSTPAITHS